MVVLLTFMLLRRLQKLVDTLEGDEKTGAKIILKALEAPLFHIAANAGLEGAVIINKVKESEARYWIRCIQRRVCRYGKGRNP